MKIEWQLLASAPTLDRSSAQVGKYFYWTSPYELKVSDNDPCIWHIYHNDLGYINNYRVRKTKGRYRFELSRKEKKV